MQSNLDPDMEPVSDLEHLPDAAGEFWLVLAGVCVLGLIACVLFLVG